MTPTHRSHDMTHPTDDHLRAALEWYADQFCELGSSHECCGRMSDDECSGCRARAALAAAPQPAPVDHDAQAGLCEDEGCPHHGNPHVCFNRPPPTAIEREELVRLLQIITRNGSLDDGRTLHEVIADALLARGLRLPGDESMAWALVGDDEAVLADTVRWERGDVDAMFSDLGPSVRVAIRVVEGGDDAA